MIEDNSKLDRVGKFGGARVYIPSNIVNDSQFPIKLGSEVVIKIDTCRGEIVISAKKQDTPVNHNTNIEV